MKRLRKKSLLNLHLDDLLSLYKSMAGVTSDISSTLSGALRESEAQLTDQKAFSEAVRKFQSQILRDLEGANSKAQGLLARIKQDMDSAIQAVVNKLHKASRVAEADINALDQVGDSFTPYFHS